MRAGPTDPYYQSERGEIYAGHYGRLEAKGLAYPCFCSDDALRLARKAQLAAGQPPRYPGTCARLSAEEVHTNVSSKRAQAHAALPCPVRDGALPVRRPGARIPGLRHRHHR
jgi:glutamyl/glutaminyl-tRNA synthetase